MTHNSTNRDWGNDGEDFAEAILQQLGRDFVFRSQQYPTANGHIELADILILLKDTAILIEVATADREKRPHRTDDEWATYANKRLEKKLVQLERGARSLRDGKVSSVKNDWQGEVPIDASRIKNIFGIIVIDHPSLDKFGSGPDVTTNEETICVLTTTHNELIDVIQELSTIGDLIDFLAARQLFFEKNSLCGNTELDLLAAYKADPEIFLSEIESHDSYILDEGLWEAFQSNTKRRIRDKENVSSYIIDLIIDTLHEGKNKKMPHLTEAFGDDPLAPDCKPGYLKVASELASLRRIDRREIGKDLLAKSQSCLDECRDRWRVAFSKNRYEIPIVFLISLASRADRSKTLFLLTTGAMLKLGTERVVGIAMEPVDNPNGFSIDALALKNDPIELANHFGPQVTEFLKSQFGPTKTVEATEF